MENQNSNDTGSNLGKIERRKYLIKKICLIADIIVIIGIIALFIYLMHEKALFEMLKGDACKICEYKTGAQCMKIGINGIVNYGIK